MDEFDDPLLKPKRKRGEDTEETSEFTDDLETEDPEDLGLDIEDSFDDDTNF
jgi:hypothetical protein